MSELHVLIVESPNKVAKIQSYLNNVPGKKFKVTSSKGHIRNMDPKCLSIDVNNNFKPTYLVTPDKKSVVSNLKRDCAKAKAVWLAADFDREGEAIAWHVSEVLKLKPENRKRIVFTEITKKAILKAIEDPGDIDMNMFHSQQARMVLDKLIGYLLSPLLWNQYSNWKLSAGRVQSVVTKIIAEREQEIKAFQSSDFFKVSANFWPQAYQKKDITKAIIDGAPITTQLDINIPIKTIEEKVEPERVVKPLLDKCNMATAVFNITDLKKSKTKRKPPPPFTTSTLQQEASNKLGMSPNVVMKCAQRLYENGLITYHRTDSLMIADDAMKSIKEFITSTWDDKHYKETRYKTKSKNSQEAHEACRPTNIKKFSVLSEANIQYSENRLYQLIWKRTVGSQMTPADVEIKTIKINLEDTDYHFTGKFEKIVFPGFLKIHDFIKDKKSNTENQDTENGEDGDNENSNSDENEDDSSNNSDGKKKGKNQQLNKKIEKILGKLKKGDQVYLAKLEALQKSSKPPKARFTEASLIKTLEEKGIGRPSTFAGMVTKVQDRNYVERKTLAPVEKEFNHLVFCSPNNISHKMKKVKVDGEKNKLFPTGLGIMVNEFLVKNFDSILDYQFTAKVESLLDEVAQGNKVWNIVVKSVYDTFNPTVEKMQIGFNKQKGGGSGGGTSNDSTGKFGMNYEKVLGNHPIHDVPIVAVNTRYGPAVVLKHDGDKKNWVYANFNGTVEDMNLEDALKLLIYPKKIGVYKDQDVILKRSKNIYIASGGKNYSIDIYNSNNRENPIDPDRCDINDAIKVIQSAGIKVSDKKINNDIVIKKGPYGFYIKYQGTKNIPIPAKQKDNAQQLTEAECLTIVEKYSNRKSKYKQPKK